MRGSEGVGGMRERRKGETGARNLLARVIQERSNHGRSKGLAPNADLFNGSSQRGWERIPPAHSSHV